MNKLLKCEALVVESEIDNKKGGGVYALWYSIAVGRFSNLRCFSLSGRNRFKIFDFIAVTSGLYRRNCRNPSWWALLVVHKQHITMHIIRNLESTRIQRTGSKFELLQVKSTCTSTLVLVRLYLILIHLPLYCYDGYDGLHYRVQVQVPGIGSEGCLQSKHTHIGTTSKRRPN